MRCLTRRIRRHWCGRCSVCKRRRRAAQAGQRIPDAEGGAVLLNKGGGKKHTELKEAERKNIIALQEARSQGDLSENADYDAARNNQAIIAAQLKEVENILNNYVLITEDEKTNLGKYITVKFLDEEGSEEEVYQLVGTVQANPLEQKISDESPLGKVILHAKIGDKVLVNTEDGEKFEVKIIDISEELGKKNKSVKKNK